MSELSSSRRGRLAVAAAALGLGGVTLGLGLGSTGAVGARAAGATVNVTYVTAKTLQVKLSDGTVVGPGASLPSGSYSVLVYDDPSTYPNPNFTMSGPGVSISSNLNSTGMGLDEPATFGPFSFSAGASYSVEDTNIGAASLITFSTSAGGGSSGSTSTGSTTTGQTTTTKTTTTTPAASGPPVGSKLVGTLEGIVSVSGKPTLTFSGKVVKTLKAGRYKVKVADHSKKVGLIVWKLGGRPVTLSGAAAVGSSTHTVTLSAGKTFFETSARGPKTYFTVK
jgi:hypothetical protein